MLVAVLIAGGTAKGQTTIGGSVYGGGNLALVRGDVTVNIQGGIIEQDIYGGGALADTNTDSENLTTKTNTTTVNLHGGTINGDVYGGGLGRLAVEAKPATEAVGTEGEPGYVPAQPAVAAVTAVEALVHGNVLVNLNSTEVTEDDDTKSYPDQCIINGNIFGCNNLNGTPKGTVTVHVYKTWGTELTAEADINDPDDDKHKYHLQAVYGGGNLAAYKPTGPLGNGTEADDKNTTTFAHVIIDGCNLTSIQTVYGGGNAASTPATQVDVRGTYEIEEVFGGGNGKDRVSRDGGTTYIDNPGANVGFYEYKDDVTGDTDTKENRASNYGYGSGEANVNIYGGLVHRVFGGSNTKGNVRIVAVTMLDNDNNDCGFRVDEAYGGGKSAPMDGASQLIMACIPGLKAAYGGAEEADINDDVTLTITNGNFDRVFGGNNVSGTIKGRITVNVEETGCRPIIIGQLYGGGNQAPYEGPGGVGPTVNVCSFTSIGEIYGGGYGKTAVVTGNTTVRINVTEGKFSTPDEATSTFINANIGTRDITFTEYDRTDDGGFVFEDGNRVSHTGTATVLLPSHDAGSIGAINNVYGGGNAAKVDGSTNVYIGDLDYVEIASVVVGTTDVSTYYTRSGAGTTADPYVYTAATGTAVANTVYYKKVTGVDIRGNVYGGGNNAEVTGDTNVVIGKKIEN